MRKYVLLMFLFSLIACGSSTKDLDVIINIDFVQSNGIKLSKKLDSEFIKLETNDSCLIASISQIEFAFDKLFITSGGHNRKVLVFDSLGKFIAQIGTTGRGPGEYIVPASFSINNHKKQISIIDMAQKKLIKYDLDNFKLVSEQLLQYSSTCFEYLGTDTMIWNNIDYKNNYADYNFIITDSNQNFLDKEVQKNFKTGYGNGRLKSMYKRNSQVFGYIQYDPIIYCFQDSGIVPMYALNFGEYQLPPIDYLEKISANNVNFISTLDESNYISYYSVFDVDKTLCIYYSVTKIPYIGLYNKSSKEAYCMTQKEFESQLKIGEMAIAGIGGTTEEHIVASLQPFDLLEKQEEGYLFDERLQTLINQSAPDDNPILFLFKLKN